MRNLSDNFTCNQPNLSIGRFHVTPENRVGGMLIVDGKKMIRECLAEVMSYVGVPTLTAADGNTGMALFQEHVASIDLVFLDYLVPDMNGEQFFHELRKINPNVKVILSFCYIQSSLAHWFQSESHIELLPKPFDLRTFLDKVGTVFAISLDRLFHADLSPSFIEIKN